MSKDHTPLTPACDEYDPDSKSFEQALAAVLDAVEAVTATEQVPLRHALDRVLAQDIHAPLNVPAHTNSAMDGYAVDSGAVPAHGTASLKITGTVFAGAPLVQRIGRGECARIMTGGTLPDGTDTVIMQEHAQIEGDTIVITQGHRRGQYVRQAGEDVRRGDVVFTRGRKLQPADVGMLASLGIAEVRVARRLRVAFFSTGDELRGIGELPGAGQIHDSNRYTLSALLTRLSAEVIDLGIIPDQRERVRAAFEMGARQADVLITSGGVSVGDADFVRETLEQLGRINFWKIAMKPGRPLTFGRIGACTVFGLPGNPVSAMVTFAQLVRPALLRMMGLDDITPLTLNAICEAPLKKVAGRLEFQRGILRVDAHGVLRVQSTGEQGSGILSSMSRANCFIVLPVECTTVAAGDVVKVQLFSGLI